MINWNKTVGCIPPVCQPYPIVSHNWGGVSTHGTGGGEYPPHGHTHHPLYIPTLPLWTYPPTPGILTSFRGYGTRDNTPPERTWTTDTPPPPQTDRHLWKHYLPATSLAGGNNMIEIALLDCWGFIHHVPSGGATMQTLPEHRNPGPHGRLEANKPQSCPKP